MSLFIQYYLHQALFSRLFKDTVYNFSVYNREVLNTKGWENTKDKETQVNYRRNLR